MLERAHIFHEPFPHARGSFVSPLRGFLVCDGWAHTVQKQAYTFGKMFYADGVDCIRYLPLQTDCASLGRARYPLPLDPTDHKQSASSRGKSISNAIHPVQNSANRFLILRLRKRHFPHYTGGASASLQGASSAPISVCQMVSFAAHAFPAGASVDRAGLPHCDRSEVENPGMQKRPARGGAFRMDGIIR